MLFYHTVYIIIVLNLPPVEIEDIMLFQISILQNLFSVLF